MYIRVDVHCTHHWRADEVRLRWQTLSEDGVRGQLLPGGEGSSWMSDDSTPSPEPADGSAEGQFNACLFRSDGSLSSPGTPLKWLLHRGPNQLVVGGFVKVNEYKADLHPYRAIVEKEITVTCTRDRRSVR